jgi:hypothetical protein
MKIYSIYIKDTEPIYGGSFFMEKIKAKNKKVAQKIAIKKYGSGAFVVINP